MSRYSGEKKKKGDCTVRVATIVSTKYYIANERVCGMSDHRGSNSDTGKKKPHFLPFSLFIISYSHLQKPNSMLPTRGSQKRNRVVRVLPCRCPGVFWSWGCSRCAPPQWCQTLCTCSQGSPCWCCHLDWWKSPLWVAVFQHSCGHTEMVRVQVASGRNVNRP